MSEGTTGNQERNIMILFLSNYHGFKYKDYKEAKLVGEGDPYTIFDSKSVKCIETNEAPLKDIQTYIGKPLDAIFYFATKAVRNLPTKNNQILRNRLSKCICTRMMSKQNHSRATKSSFGKC